MAKLQKLQQNILKNDERINKAMQMMLEGKIDTGEYRAIKSRYEQANTTLLKERASLEIDKIDYASKINGSFNLLRHIDKFYTEANVQIKQKLMGLIFPEKLIFENSRVQTPRMNEILSFIMMEHSDLETIKKGSKKNFSLQSPKVSLQGLLVPAAMRSRTHDPLDHECLLKEKS